MINAPTCAYAVIKSRCTLEFGILTVYLHTTIVRFVI